LSVGSLAAVIVVILAVGFIREGLIKPNRPVATVNEVKIATDDFQDLVTFRRYNLHLNIDNLNANLAQLPADDETSEFLRSFYQQQIEQLQTALALAPDSALDELIEDELIREKAEELQITVSAAEVDASIDSVIDDLLQSVSPPGEVVTGTELTPTPTPIPRKTMYELYINSMRLSTREYRTITQRSLLRNKLQEWFAGQVMTTGLVVHAQLIETETEEQALAAQQRIEGGEEFAVVAQEVSTDTLTAEEGGDLGWLATGQLAARYGEEVETAVFAADIGQMSLVESNEMFYLVQLLDRDENGPLPEEVLQPLQDNALNEWIEERKSSPEVEIERLLDPSQIPDDPFL
jgi:parvulin-like peptidyl-prolyl isomerase